MTHKLIRHEAEEFAGAFYEQNRSAVFRQQWPDQMVYVRRNWKHFVVHVRNVFAEMLGRPDVTQEMKDRIYAALIVDAPAAISAAAQDIIQVAPGSETFEGDKAQHRQTEEMVRSKGLRQALLGTAARYAH